MENIKIPKSECISIRHNCGILGYISYDLKYNFIKELFTALDCLKHRGQDSTGISYLTTDNKIKTYKKLGQPNLVFKNFYVERNFHFCGIGHLRYSTRKKTTNENKIKECQPFYFKNTKSKLGSFSMAHNGNIPHIEKLIKKFKIDIETQSDSLIVGYIIELIAEDKDNWKDVFVSLLKQISGVFCLMILTNDGIYAMKDRYGLRPLCIGSSKKMNKLMIASESNAFCFLDYKFVREIKPGEIIFARKPSDYFSLDKTISYESIYLYKEDISNFSKKKHTIKDIEKYNEKDLIDIEDISIRDKFCSFELIYFFRHNSIFENKDGSKRTISSIRGELGYMMAKMESTKYPDLIKEIDYVLVIPETPIPSGAFFSAYLGIEFKKDFIIKTNLVNRTFILATDKERKEACHKKFKFSKFAQEKLPNSKIYLIDDSIVRGNVSQVIIKDLKRIGVKEIHMRIMSPPIKGTCHYGIDLSTEKELIANGKSIDEIRITLGCTTLEYLNINNMKDVFKDPICTECFYNKDYLLKYNKRIEM